MTHKIILFLFVVISSVLFANKSNLKTCTLKVELDGPIGAGVSDYLKRAQEHAVEDHCSSVLLTINTPGGSLQTTRIIVEQILASEIPYLCLVSPAGGHAGSAGAIILQACHVSGAVETTNIGAATPVLGNGGELKGDMRNKILNDTVSWTTGLAKFRGRDIAFAREIIEKGTAVEAKEAKRRNAIDILSVSIDDFLTQATGQKVRLPEDRTAAVVVGELVEFKKDLRSALLDFIADPQIAYLLFMGSLALLYFEITHPGTMVPGVLGALGLILSLIAFHLLAVQWGGLALMVLGLGLLIAEAFVVSFGILGIGGITAFIFGGILLFDTPTTGLGLSLKLILPTAIGIGIAMMFLGYLASRALKKKKTSGIELLLHETAEVVSVDVNDPSKGMLFVKGETWSFHGHESFKVGDHVKIQSSKGLTLSVKKKES
jgi:membrane-bound serine protease (ClpP class)